MGSVVEEAPKNTEGHRIFKTEKGEGTEKFLENEFLIGTNQKINAMISGFSQILNIRCWFLFVTNHG